MGTKNILIKLKEIPRIFSDHENTLQESAAYLAGWMDGTKLQAEISFKAGQESKRARFRKFMVDWNSRLSIREFMAKYHVIEWLKNAGGSKV